MTKSGHGIDNDDLFIKFGSAKLMKKRTGVINFLLFLIIRSSRRMCWCLGTTDGLESFNSSLVFCVYFALMICERPESSLLLTLPPN